MLVLSKGPLRSSASYLAQGGVAAATGEDDSPELHAEDTIRAGRGLSRQSAVEALADEAPARVADLEALGVAFDPEPGLEGGHSRRRVMHVAGAATGKEILRVLVNNVLEHPRIHVSEGETVRELERIGDRCTGVVTNRRRVAARATLLAAGGAASLWERTTNPPGATGDGMAMALRAGARLADLEFVQFHPTVLAANGLLLSEALRGEGAVLVDAEGQRFTDELAPRDVVARAVGERGTALLDLRTIDRGRFPALMEALEQGDSPGARADPGVSGGSLHDGRDRHRPRWTGPTWPASTPRGSAPAQVSTAPIALRRTPCSSAWSSAAGRPWPRWPTRLRTGDDHGGESTQSSPPTRVDARAAAGYPAGGRPRPRRRRPPRLAQVTAPAPARLIAVERGCARGEPRRPISAPTSHSRTTFFRRAQRRPAARTKSRGLRAMAADPMPGD